MKDEKQGIFNSIKKAGTVPAAIVTCAVLFILFACALLALLLIFGWKLVYLV